ncbi:DMT family transporter [Chloroflexota bacterium]
MPIQALPSVIVLSILFGTTLIASRFGVGQFEPTTYIGLRMLIASLCHLAVFALVPGQKFPTDRRLLQRSVILGMIVPTIPMTLIVTSLLYMSSGMSALLLTASPAITVLMANFFLPDEPFTRRKGFGVALALSGAIMLVLMGETGLADDSTVNPIGYVLMFISLIASSIGTIYTRKYLHGYDNVAVASIRMFTATLIVLPFSVLFVGFDLSQVTPPGYFALLYAALIGTFAGLLLSIRIIDRYGATASAMSTYLIPIVSGIGGVLLLDELVTTGMILAMVVIVAGIAILNQRQSDMPVVPPQSVVKPAGRR